MYIDIYEIYIHIIHIYIYIYITFLYIYNHIIRCLTENFRDFNILQFSRKR